MNNETIIIRFIWEISNKQLITYNIDKWLLNEAKIFMLYVNNGDISLDKLAPWKFFQDHEAISYDIPLGKVNELIKESEEWSMERRMEFEYQKRIDRLDFHQSEANSVSYNERNKSVIMQFINEVNNCIIELSLFNEYIIYDDASITIYSIPEGLVVRAIGCINN